MFGFSGESDSESICISPLKGQQPQRTCVVSKAERDWELERLREIQKEEGDLLGYSFTSDEKDQLWDQYSNSPSHISLPFFAEEENEVSSNYRC